jgi:hypothetical protein
MVIEFVRFLVPLSLYPALYASSGKDSTLEPTCLQVESLATEDPSALMVHGQSLDSHWHLHHLLGLMMGFVLWAVVGKAPYEGVQVGKGSSGLEV